MNGVCAAPHTIGIHGLPTRNLRSYALPGGWGTRPYVVHRLRWFSNGADEPFALQVQNDFLGSFLWR